MTESSPQPFSHPGFKGWIGACREDITPPIGIYFRNWGAATEEVAAGVHRPLSASALTLQISPDARPVVLMSLDLGWWRSSRDEWYVRGYVLKALDLTPDRLMIHFTHTHAGPVLCREDEDKPGGEKIGPYLDSLREAIIRVIRGALATAAPAALEWRYGRCGLARNRDLPDPDNPRYLSGFNPSAPADDTLLVGRATDDGGRILAILVNYACHPTTLAWDNHLLSPDFVGAMRETVEGHTGQAICLYLHGASGELAPREQYTSDTEIADANGRQLGFAVLATLAGMLPRESQLVYSGFVESGAPLAVWQMQSKASPPILDAVQSEIEYCLQQMPTAQDLNLQIEACEDRVLAERLRRKRRIREGVGDGAAATMPFWVWRVGECILIGHPNEAYSRLQTALRERFPDRAIAVMNVVNGHYGYLPPAHLYNLDLYPVWQTPFGAGSLERLIAACEHAIQTGLDS